MSDKVKLIIEIPKYYLEHPQDYTCLAECVRRGIVLPKGHGRLIDENILRYGLRNSYLDSFGLIRVENVLKNTDTIIEADRAESEG